MNSIFKTDILLGIAALLTIISGIALHIAGQEGDHEMWHAMAVTHVVFSLLFVITAVKHISHHRVWYRNLLRPSKRHRTATLLLTLAMAFETVTGIVLLIFVDGEGSGAGRAHWVGGILLAVLATGHFAKRFKILRKGVKRR